VIKFTRLEERTQASRKFENSFQAIALLFVLQVSSHFDCAHHALQLIASKNLQQSQNFARHVGCR